MAKSMIRNTLGTKTMTFYLPCKGSVAGDICSSLLDGEYSVFETDGANAGGNEKETAVYNVTVQLKSADNLKTYVNFAMKANKTAGDVESAFVGTTVNGLKVKSTLVLGMSKVNYETKSESK